MPRRRDVNHVAVFEIISLEPGTDIAMSAAPKLSDHEFVIALRAAIEQYFTAVDRWETAYQKYYRMPGTVTISPDVAAEQREYDELRRRLQELLPRARRLCLKHQLQEPFSGCSASRWAGTPRKSAWIRPSAAVSAVS